ncbi:MAG: acyltransferase family protein [Oleispira sp.]
MSKGFRQDINGLRAWAVVAVILFHFGVPGFSGGFVGVDIFFVISGFLMTGIIYKGLVDQSFSILKFYLARAKRIIPALLVLCTVLLALGWVYLPAVEYEQLGKHVFGAITFLSNFIFRSESGYFHPTSDETWLLHTWSLSVEWQFYILLPLVLAVIWRIFPSRNTLLLSYIAGIIISLYLSIIYTNIKPTAAYYYLPTRAWEMLAGGFVFLIAKNKPRHSKAYEIAGFSCIILAICVFNTQTPWPGWEALLPVIGTCLVLYAKEENSYFSATRAHNVIGSLSYSLYLWHWPIVVGLTYAGHKDTPALIAAGIAVSIILGWASYRFVEMKSVAIYSKSTKSTTLISITSAVALIALAGLSINHLKGVYGRLPTEIENIFDTQRDSAIPHNCQKGCSYGGSDVALVLFGDSHAESIIHSLEHSMPRKDLGFIAITATGCPPISGTFIKNKKRCDNHHQNLIIQLDKLPAKTPVLITASLSSYIHDGTVEINNEVSVGNKAEYQSKIASKLKHTLCQLAQSRPVYITTPTPEMLVNVPKFIGRSTFYYNNSITDILLDMEVHTERNRIALSALAKAKAECGINILETTPYLCKKTHCTGMRDGAALYFDDDHLSQTGALLLIPLFTKIFKDNISN